MNPAKRVWYRVVYTQAGPDATRVVYVRATHPDAARSRFSDWSVLSVTPKAPPSPTPNFQIS